MTPWQIVWYLAAFLLLALAGVLTLAKVEGRVTTAMVMFAGACFVLAYAWPGLAH